jgi:23S rRNA pseudouridine2604 synthase
LTTIKLSKKPINTPATGKAPVRRADPTKRDRTKAPPKPVFKADSTEESQPFTKGKVDSRVRGNDERGDEQAKTKGSARQERPARAEGARTAPTRQRNHRHDGSLHEDNSARPVHKEEGAETRAARAPNANRALNSDRTPSSDRAQSTYKTESSARKPNTDTRTTPRGSREEPQYRQAPRRGGKVRDGFDATAPSYGAAAKAAYKSTTTNDDLPRLSKLMAERGLCSRREADEWIVNGWVKVNGEIVDTLGTRVAPDVEIVISGYAKEHQAEHVTILLHKPVGYVSGQAEDGYEPAIVLVHPENQWEEDTTQKMFQRGFLKGLAPAGRLDIDSTGLLVLTQDGRVARHLIGEDSTVEKEYLVRVEGELSPDGLAKLNHGLSLDGVKLKPAKVSWQNEDQLRFVLREGKKRQIRRMCEMVGLHVVGLKRVRIGSVNLGKLPVGEWRYLRDDERF